MYSLVLLSIIFQDKLASNRPPHLIYVTRLPRRVTLETFRPPLSLAMTDHGLRATAHVGHLYLRLANPGRTGIAQSLHYPPPPARTCSKPRNHWTIPQTNLRGITPLQGKNPDYREYTVEHKHKTYIQTPTSVHKLSVHKLSSHPPFHDDNHHPRPGTRQHNPTEHQCSIARHT